MPMTCLNPAGGTLNGLLRGLGIYQLNPGNATVPAAPLAQVPVDLSTCPTLRVGRPYLQLRRLRADPLEFQRGNVDEWKFLRGLFRRPAGARCSAARLHPAAACPDSHGMGRNRPGCGASYLRRVETPPPFGLHRPPGFAAAGRATFSSAVHFRRRATISVSTSEAPSGILQKEPPVGGRITDRQPRRYVGRTERHRLAVKSGCMQPKRSFCVVPPSAHWRRTETTIRGGHMRRRSTLAGRRADPGRHPALRLSRPLMRRNGPGRVRFLVRGSDQRLAATTLFKTG